MQPPFDIIAYGQIDIMLLLLLTLALLGLRDERPWLVGLAIALGALFKLYPLLLAAFLLVRHEWKALGWLVGWLDVWQLRNNCEPITPARPRTVRSAFQHIRASV